MARRRTSRKKTTRRRSPKPMINVLNFAEGFIVANAGTKAVFGADLVPFLTEGWLTEQSIQTDNSWEVSAKELVMGLTGQGKFGFNQGSDSIWSNAGLMDAIKYNLSRSGPQIATVILTPIAFKAGKRIARQPISRLNKGIKALGLSSTIKV